MMSSLLVIWGMERRELDTGCEVNHRALSPSLRPGIAAEEMEEEPHIGYLVARLGLYDVPIFSLEHLPADLLPARTS